MSRFYFFVFIITMMLCLSVDKASAGPSEAATGVAQVEKFDVPNVEYQTQSGVYRYNELPPMKEALMRKKKKKFQGYTKQKSYFYNLCMALYEDGRAALVAKVGEKNKAGTPDCPACKPFFRLLFSQCKKVPPKFRLLEKKIADKKRKMASENSGKQRNKKRPIKKEEIAPEEVSGKNEKEQTLAELEAQLPKKQREPKLLVVDAVLRFSQVLADSKKNLDDNHRAVRSLERALRNPQGKTEGEKEYFDIFSTYLKAPFDEYEERADFLVQQEEQKLEQRRREFILDSHQEFKSSHDLPSQ